MPRFRQSRRGATRRNVMCGMVQHPAGRPASLSACLPAACDSQQIKIIVKKVEKFRAEQVSARRERASELVSRRIFDLARAFVGPCHAASRRAVSSEGRECILRPDGWLTVGMQGRNIVDRSRPLRSLKSRTASLSARNECGDMSRSQTHIIRWHASTTSPHEICVIREKEKGIEEGRGKMEREREREREGEKERGIYGCFF